MFLFLETAIKYLADKKLKPFILLHETYDLKIAKLLQEKITNQGFNSKRE